MRRQACGQLPSLHFLATVRYSSRLAKLTVIHADADGNCRHARLIILLAMHSSL